MSIYSALTGLNAAQHALDSTSNNISNAQTVGFKKSRSEFGDIFQTNAALTPGEGSQPIKTSQNFIQGNLNNTGRALDLAINGQGFFVVSDPNQRYLTRNGQFQMDKDGYIVTNTGMNLMGTTVKEEVVKNPDGSSYTKYLPQSSDADTKLKVNIEGIKPKATSKAIIKPKIDSRVKSNEEQMVKPAGTVLMRAKIKNTDNEISFLKIPTRSGFEYYTEQKDPAQANANPYIKVDYDEESKSIVLPANVSMNNGSITTDDDAQTLRTSVDYINFQGQLTRASNKGPSIYTNSQLKNLGLQFDPDKSDTYQSQSSQIIYDSKGNQLYFQQFYVKVPPTTATSLDPNASTDVGENVWKVYNFVQDMKTGKRLPLKVGNSDFYVSKFDQKGNQVGLYTPNQEEDPNKSPVLLTSSNLSLINNENKISFTKFDAALLNKEFGRDDEEFGDVGFEIEVNSSVGAQDFDVSSFSQDGYASAELSGMYFNKDGVLIARYTNGQTTGMGSIMLANVKNEQGLDKNGRNLWSESFAAGETKIDKPNSEVTGEILPEYLESSNVELSTELVGLIEAQVAYQANAQAIQSQDRILQTVSNLKS